MRRIVPVSICLLTLLLACQAVTRPVSKILSSHESVSITPTELEGFNSFTETPSFSSTPHFTFPSHPSFAASATPDLPAGVNFTVRFHPDGGLYVGDQVSLEVIPTPEANLDGWEVLVQVDEPAGKTLKPAKFGRFGIAGRSQATLIWAWDTSGLIPGAHELNFTVLPGGSTWSQIVSLLPEDQLPVSESQARWATSESQCCNVYYITQTASERDLIALLQMVDEQAESANQILKAELDQPIAVTFVPRMLGHGGFTNQEVSVSYLDRNYADSSPAMVLHHELVHLLDNRLGGEYRPTLLIEGLAVYLSGGHFKPEDLIPRAAALLELGAYIPLEPLTKDFYISQHETGYMEAGALVAFIVENWGWEAFSSFYRDIHSPENGDQTGAINAALKNHYGVTLRELEEQFLKRLKAQPVSTDVVEDVRLSLSYYDTVRRYQQAFDPSAYFLTAWMMDGEQMRRKGIVADYARHPTATENLALENMLASAGRSLRQEDYSEVETELQAVSGVLDGVAEGRADPFTGYPLAMDYFNIVQALKLQGLQAQRILVENNTARVWANTTGPQLSEVALLREFENWQIISVAQ